MGTLLIVAKKENKKKTGSNLNVNRREITEYIFMHLHYIMEYDLAIKNMSQIYLYQPGGMSMKYC